MEEIRDPVKKNLSRLQKYCARQDRSVQKIREKLYEITELSSREKAWIIARLEEDLFLDDERFAHTYVRSKVNQNKWGRQKIRQGLMRHRIAEKTIEESMRGIDESRYNKNLKDLLKTKRGQTQDHEKWIRYLLQRGYDYEEVFEAVNK